MPGHSGLRALVLATLLGAVLSGCSHKQEPPRTGAAPPPPPFASSASSEEESTDPQDPCALLDPKEVEAVLGEPLAVPPFRVGSGGMGPHSSGPDCMYETKNFRYLTLTATFEGGQQEYSFTQMVKGQLKSRGTESIANNVNKNFQLDDGTELSGEWDEASLTPMNCCIFNALRGDQLLSIDFTGTRLSLRQVAPLVDSALKRMDKPLHINGNAGVAAALALDKTRPKPVDVCSLLTRAEVEAIVGPLGADPVAKGHDFCTYSMPRTPGTVPLEYEVMIRWRNGYYQWRSDRHVGNIAFGAVAQTVRDRVGEMGGTLQKPADAEHQSAAGGAAADPAESVSDDGMNYVIVKQDVEVAVNSRFVDKARAQVLVAALAAKI